MIKVSKVLCRSKFKLTLWLTENKIWIIRMRRLKHQYLYEYTQTVVLKSNEWQKYIVYIECVEYNIAISTPNRAQLASTRRPLRHRHARTLATHSHHTQHSLHIHTHSFSTYRLIVRLMVTEGFTGSLPSKELLLERRGQPLPFTWFVIFCSSSALILTIFDLAALFDNQFRVVLVAFSVIVVGV